MLLGDILHPEVVKTSLEAENKYEAIDELVDLLVESHEIPVALRDHILEVVTEREKSMSTGMEHGIALPHGATDRVDDIIGALGVSRRGVPFESLDGQPAHVIILLVLPKNKFQAHVRTLGGIAHLMSNAGLREALKNAGDSASVLKLVEEEEDRAALR
ncbi:MAG TPA: PTS sugar transporter subunit IIA [Candidatus Hydrogenedentes bacterium]|nr:PTS sugar transporter subunit IIA [Candidatus Hydrogenedentota bacterium]